MIKSVAYAVLSFFLISIFTLSVSPISAEVPILDENGNQTGLINMNPDLNAEAWVAGGFREMSQEEIEAIPELKLPESILNRPLPSSVDNTQNPQFRPIFNQKGGSCAQASGIAYTFTYEINCLRDLASNVSENQYPYGFTYNFLNRGSSSNGSGYTSGWNIVMRTGCPNVDDYGGELYGGNGSLWLSGYDNYYNGMFNRIESSFNITMTEPDGLNSLRQWLYDHAGAQDKGGLVTFSSYSSGSQIEPLPAGTPEAGKEAVIKWGTSSGGHAMTIGGYNDSIRWDYNNDGRYTTDEDINNDGVVDLMDCEIGGVLMINSWGSNWADGGKAYMMYWVLANPSGVGGVTSSNRVYGIHCIKDYTPLLTCKISITHNERDNVKITAGMSNDLQATTPFETHTFSSAFNYAGGAWPMEGEGLSSTIEIGLDVTPLLDEMTGDEAKFFLRIDSEGGIGQINTFSMIDYTGASPEETACNDQNVTITPGTPDNAETTYLSILFTGAPRITLLSPANGDIWEQNTSRTITWVDNINGNVKIDLYKGSTLDKTITGSTASSGSFNWDIPADQAIGTDYKMVITSIDDPLVTDESGVFAIEEEFIITEFPYIEPFDELDTGITILPERWEQLRNDDIDWIVLSGPTPSKVGSDPDITGPDSDHTSGVGNYIYIEASGDNNPDKKAEFVTPKFDIRDLEDPELTFWCHMYSSTNNMGDLYLDISVDGSWQNDVIHLTDNQGDEWFQVTQDLTNYAGERVIFRFRGITGSNWASDICIDDFKVAKAATPIIVNPFTLSSYDLRYYNSRVHFQIPENKHHKDVTFTLYNVQGKMIKELVFSKMNSGYHSINLDAFSAKGQLAAGVYLCKLKTEGFHKTIAIMVQK